MGTDIFFICRLIVRTKIDTNHQLLALILHKLPLSFQVDLEPQGKIHVIVELKWHGKFENRINRCEL